MMVKGVLLMLVVLAVLGMFGRLRFGGSAKPPPRIAGRCPSCGRPLIGKGPCECKVSGK